MKEKVVDCVTLCLLLSLFVFSATKEYNRILTFYKNVGFVRLSIWFFKSRKSCRLFFLKMMLLLISSVMICLGSVHTAPSIHADSVHTTHSVHADSVHTAPSIHADRQSFNATFTVINDIITEILGVAKNTTSASLSKKSRSDQSPNVDFDWSRNGHDIPMFISELNNQAGLSRFSSLLDRAIVRAPWNVLTAKMFRLVVVFFLESYLVQLFGVSLPLWGHIKRFMDQMALQGVVN